MANWEQLLSLKRFGDKHKRIRKEQDDTRLGFEVDYDRIVFSSAFRSLQDKTQVIPLSETDFVHTRLTHSLEVSVVGRSLGRNVGKAILKKYPYLAATHGFHFNDFGAIVAAAAIAHDIGNPPFGHSGENAMSDYFKTGPGQRFQSQIPKLAYQDLTHFEGNANGFKLLTETRDGSVGGLRLSYATLASFTKYPKASLPHQPTSQIAHKKYGYFSQQAEFFDEVARDVGLPTSTHEHGQSYARHPLAFLVEAADDICYTIIDFEDGINLGLIPEDYALEYLSKLINHKIDVDKYAKLNTTKNRVAYLRSLAIGTLIQETVDIFMANETAILNGDFHVDLLSQSRYKAQIKDIINISIKNVYRSQEVMDKEIVGYKVLTSLLHEFTTAVEHQLNGQSTSIDRLILANFLPHFNFDQSPTEDWLIAISSHIAAMTDSEALRTYKKLTGMAL